MSNLPQKKEPNLVGTITKSVVPEAMVVEAVVDIAKEAMNCFTDYMKCREQEKTERQRIAATLRTITEQITANKEVTLEAIRSNHQKFKELLDFARQNVNMASENGDVEMVRAHYGFIITMNQMIEGSTDRHVNGYLSQTNVSNLLLK